MIPTLQTARLTLQPLSLQDAEATQNLFPHWEVVRFLAAVVPWPYPPDGAERYLRDVALPAMERGEELHWSLRLKSDPSVHIGAIGLFPKSELEQRGFWLGLPWHGQGLMTEAVLAVNRVWFDVLGMPVLRTSKAVANLHSRRISEKTGMRLIGTTEKDYVSGRQASQLWEMAADEWRAFEESHSQDPREDGMAASGQIESSLGRSPASPRSLARVRSDSRRSGREQ